MTEELQTLNSPGNTPPASPTPQPATVVPKAPAVRKSQKLKKIAWRGTATIYWVWWIVRLVLGSEFINHIASVMTGQLGTFLSSIGFAPAHSEYLPKILQAGWLSAIVGFKPLEFFWLIIYIYIAPLTFFGYLVFKDYAKDLDAAPTDKRGLRPPRIRRPALTIVGLLLLGWFALYGEASSRRPLIAGAILSGFLFFALAGRAFQRAKPPTYRGGGEPVSAYERIGFALFTSAPDTVSNAMKAKKKSEVVGGLFIYQKLRSLWRFLALLMWGEAGRNRLYLLILVDYVVSLLVLGAAAILFWSILAKLACAPTTSSLATFIRISSSYFLPNIKSPSIETNLPVWVQIGPSITAFILFVLFVGAAASLLPSRYSAYTERLNMRYRVARKFALSFKRTARALEQIKLSKPKGQITRAAS